MGLHCWLESAVKVLFHIPDALMKGKQTKYISIISADGVWCVLRFSFFLQFSALISEKNCEPPVAIVTFVPRKEITWTPNFSQKFRIFKEGLDLEIVSPCASIMYRIYPSEVPGDEMPLELKSAMETILKAVKDSWDQASEWADGFILPIWPVNFRSGMFLSLKACFRNN